MATSSTAMRPQAPQPSPPPAPRPSRQRRRARNVNVTANQVNVTPSLEAAPKPRRNRNRRRPVQDRSLAGNVITGMPPSPAATGRTTVDDITTEVSGECVDPSDGAVGWFYKYLDPAGSVESGRAIGEFSKIPDGLLRFSVDAEQRPIVTEECPNVSNSSIPLDGELWSVSFISFPAFRLNYIAVANVNNNVLTPEDIAALLSTLNNLTDWRAKADGEWREFVEGWYYKIRVLPNTFLMADSEGRTDDITEFRKTTKGVTFEFNAPTLIDQGWWVGGHVPIRPRPLTVPASANVPSTVSVAVVSFTGPSALQFTVGLTGQTISGLVVAGAGQLFNISASEFSVFFATTETVVTRTVVQPIYLNDVLYADVGDNVSLSVVQFTAAAVQFRYSSSRAGAPDITSPVLRNDSRRFNIEFTTLAESGAYNKLSLAMPALTPEELTTNNPKIEQFLCKESGGAYIVHYKMSNPVFEMTGEENYGYFEFHYPGYSASDVLGARGIRDTFEANFTTCVVHFVGLSKSTSIVSKTYDGWEGTTNAGTTVGMFAHTGATEEVELVDLANHLQTDLTGVYAADDNFAALIASLASVALKGVLKSAATPAIVKGLAQKAVGAVVANPDAVEKGVKAIGGIGARLVASIKARRARRRLRAR